MSTNVTSFSPIIPDSSMTSATLKIALLLLTGVSVHFSLTPPQTAVQKTVVARGSFFERSILWFTFGSKVLVWIMALNDAFITYLQAYHPSASLWADFSPAHPFTEFDRPVNPLLSPSPTMIIATLVVAFASLLRQWCYRKLGSLFTFEITIQPSHSLITSGPYSVVRHPSYTGVYLTLIGSTVVGFAPGSYLRECWLNSWLNGSPAGPADGGGLVMFLLSGIGQVLVCALVTLWFATGTYALRSTIKRVHIEDHELHRVFGKQWEEWAARVRWKLVPGIF